MRCNTASKKEYLMFSRSSSIGMHRYAGIWTGDNSAWWQHILLLFKQLPSLNMCGFLYVGADLGGFSRNTTEDLLLRWIALGTFVPLMRNHSTPDSREQELYQFDKKDVFRNFLNIRYALLPYLYDQYVKCAVQNEMLFRPLAFDYPLDKRVRTIETQLMFGDSIMLAPIFEQNEIGRYVYLPEDMKMIRMKAYNDYTETILKKGDHYIEIPLDEIVFFIKKGGEISLTEPKQNVESLDFENLTKIRF